MYAAHARPAHIIALPISPKKKAAGRAGGGQRLVSGQRRVAALRANGVSHGVLAGNLKRTAEFIRLPQHLVVEPLSLESGYWQVFALQCSAKGDIEWTLN